MTIQTIASCLDAEIGKQQKGYSEMGGAFSHT